MFWNTRQLAMAKFALKKCGENEIPSFITRKMVEFYEFRDKDEFFADCRELDSILTIAGTGRTLARATSIEQVQAAYEDYAVKRHKMLQVRMDTVDSCRRVRIDVTPFTSAIDKILNDLTYENRGLGMMIALWNKWENEND